jgi:protein TonB
MEIKKTPKADLENRKFLYREIGLIIALAFVFAAFEYKTYDNKVEALESDNSVVLEEEMIPITKQELPPPEMPKIPVITDQFEVVDNNIKITTNVDFSTEDRKDLAVNIKDYTKGSGNREEVVEEEEIPFTIVEEKPKFMNGDENTFTKWVFERLIYPELAKENGVQGRVSVSFLVNTDGTVSDVKVLRGVDASLDKEAIRVISSSPKWQPGRQRGKPVKVRYVFPVIFQLR